MILDKSVNLLKFWWFHYRDEGALCVWWNGHDLKNPLSLCLFYIRNEDSKQVHFLSYDINNELLLQLHVFNRNILQWAFVWMAVMIIKQHQSCSIRDQNIPDCRFILHMSLVTVIQMLYFKIISKLHMEKVMFCNTINTRAQSTLTQKGRAKPFGKWSLTCSHSFF